MSGANPWQALVQQWSMCLGLGGRGTRDRTSQRPAVTGVRKVNSPMKKKKHSRQPPLAPQDIQDLAHVLRKEHLFIQAEKQQIQHLNVQVSENSDYVLKLNWQVRQFRQIVDKAVLAAAAAAPNDVNSIKSAEFTLGSLCYSASTLNTVTFIESNKRLSNKEHAYANLLGSLRTNPTILASCLATDISSSGKSYPEITQIIVSSIYGDGIVPENRALIVQLIKELCIQQVAPHESPKRLLRHGSCAFSKLLKSFLETLPSARLFLYSALREAVIAVLVKDDMYLDIDDERAAIRFPPEGKMRHFGKEGSPEYQEKLEKYKASSKLHSLVEKFVRGIQDSLFCFPDSLSSIIRYVYTSLTDESKKGSTTQATSGEISAICTDLIFSNFICHACINPEMYGIVDMHITQVARFNLMQVAQIIQVLAMSKFEEVDPRFREICTFFTEKDSLTTVLDKVLNGGVNEPDGYHEQKKLEGVDRLVVLITESDLYQFSNFIHDVASCSQNLSLKGTLDDALTGVPRDRIFNDSSSNQRTLLGARGNSIADESNGKKSLLNKVRRTKTLTDPSNVEQTTPVISTAPKEVLVIEIRRQSQLLGLLPEEQVLEQEIGNTRQTKVRMNLNHTHNGADGIESLPNDKQTKFSQDQESIGTSDNLEAVSEGASTHSVESSLDETDTENDDANDANADDDVDDNDNLSDMVSANVSSGRGTPNVSGRDTPSSHSSSDEEGQNGAAVAVSQIVVTNSQGTTSTLGPSPSTQANIPRQRPTLNSIPVETPRRTQNDIEEKFGKFDCNPSSTTGLAADETKSLLSDTWSTDVLASDSEAAQNDPQHDHHPAAVLLANMASRHNSSSVSFVQNLENPTIQINMSDVNHQESTDDILEKYRKKDTGQGVNRQSENSPRPPVDGAASGGGGSGPPGGLNAPGGSAAGTSGGGGGRGDAGGGGGGGSGGGGGESGDDGGHNLDNSSNSKKINSNNDFNGQDPSKPCRITSTKRVLRRVLSNVNIHAMPQLVSHSLVTHRPSARDDLLNFMRTLLAEAKHQGNAQVVALQEAVRSIDSLDDKSCHQVFKLLREDHKKRGTYINYLINSRQQLLSLEAHFENVTEYLNKERRVCLHNLVVVAVKLYLEGKEKALASFVKCFQKLNVSDEKARMVDNFLSILIDSMDKETIWKVASDEQLKHARAIIERSVMSQVYANALYPNGDGDILRDQILHQHISKLAKVVSLNHEYLRIPSKYHSEAPWPSAVEEISTINAFKTPREKVSCVVRTCTIIMNLLQLASERSVATADDLIPVLVYVLLQANPPSLLSTVQFVTSFYESRFEGEEAYWWTQFASAVEFTKTMDYEDSK